MVDHILSKLKDKTEAKYKSMTRPSDTDSQQKQIEELKKQIKTLKSAKKDNSLKGDKEYSRRQEAINKLEENIRSLEEQNPKNDTVSSGDVKNLNGAEHTNNASIPLYDMFKAVHEDLLRYTHKILHSFKDFTALPSLVNKLTNKDTQVEQDAINQTVSMENHTIANYFKFSLDSMYQKIRRVVDSEELQEAYNLALKDDQKALESASEKLKQSFTSLEGTFRKNDEHYQFTQKLDPDRMAKARLVQFTRWYHHELEGHSQGASDRARELEKTRKEVEATKKTICDLDMTNKASQDKKVLEKLSQSLDDFAEVLEEAAQKEKNAALATNRIRDVYVVHGVSSNEIKAVVDNNKSYIVNANQAAKKAMEYKKEILKLLEHHLEDTIYRNQARAKIAELRRILVDKDEQKEKDRTQAFLLLDMVKGKVTINGVWMDFKKIEKFVRVDDNTTRVEFRPDVAKIKLWHHSREGGEAPREWDVKRLLEGGYENEKYKIILEIPSDTFLKNERRRELRITFIEKAAKKQEEKRVHDLINERYPDARDNEQREIFRRNIDTHSFTKVQTFDMDRVKEINLRVNLLNEKDRSPDVGVDYTVETMPNPIIKHDQTLRTNYDPDAAKKCAKIYLPTMELIGPNGLTLDLSKLDLTETEFKNKDEGLIVRLAGPPDISYIRLSTALSMGGMGEEILKLENNAKNLISGYMNQCLENLEKTLNETDDKKSIERAFNNLEQMKWLSGCIIDDLIKASSRAPRNRIESEQHHAAKSQIIPAQVKDLNAYLAEATEVQKTAQHFYSNLKDSLRADLLRSSEEQKEARSQELSDAEHLDEVFPSRLLENSLLAEDFIKEIVEGAGKASYIIERLMTQSDTLAKNAQRKTEEDIFNQLNNALTTYRTSQVSNSDNDSGYGSDSDNDSNEDKSLEVFHTTVRNALNRVMILKGKADVVEATQTRARLTGDISIDKDRSRAKDKFIKEKVENCAIKTRDEMVDSIIETVNAAIEEKERKAARFENPKILAMQQSYEAQIRERVSFVKSDIHEDDTIQDHCVEVIIEARKESIELLNEDTQPGEKTAGNDQFEAAKRSDFNRSGLYVENEVEYIQEKTSQAHEDAYKSWNNENEYEVLLAKKELEYLERAIDTESRKAISEGKDGDAAGARIACDTAIYTTEKVEVIKSRLAFSKSNDEASRERAFEDAGYIEKKLYSKESNRGRRARRAIRAATYRRMWAEAEENTLQAARTIADLQELPKKPPSTDESSPYKQAIDKARQQFKDFAEDAAKRDRSPQDIEEQDLYAYAARLDAAQRYAQGTMRIADATKKAVNAAEATAKAEGKDTKAVAEARARAEQVVRGLSEIARTNNKASGGDGMEAAVIAAEQAAEAEALIKEKISEVIKTAKDAAQLAYKNDLAEQEKFLQTVAEDTDAFIDGSPENAMDAFYTNIDAKTEKIRPKIEGLYKKVPIHRVFTDFIDNNSTLNKRILDVLPVNISDKNVRNIVMSSARVMRITQRLMVLEAILEMVTVNNNFMKKYSLNRRAARVLLFPQKEQKFFRKLIKTIKANDTINVGSGDESRTYKKSNIDTARIAKSVIEYSIGLKMSIMVLQAEHTIKVQMGEIDPAQPIIEAQTGEINSALSPTLDEFYRTLDTDGLVAAVHYAEARTLVAEAVLEATEATEDVKDRQNVAKSVRDEAELAKEEKDNISQKHIRSAKLAKRAASALKKSIHAQEVGRDAAQAVIDAGHRVQMILDKVSGHGLLYGDTDNRIQNTLSMTGEIQDATTIQMNTRVNAAKQLAAHYIDIMQYVRDAEKSGGDKAAKDVLDTFIRAKASKQAAAAQSLISLSIGEDDISQRIAAKNAEQAVRDRPHLDAAKQHAASLAQIAKSIRSMHMEEFVILVDDIEESSFIESETGTEIASDAEYGGQPGFSGYSGGPPYTTDGPPYTTDPKDASYYQEAVFTSAPEARPDYQSGRRPQSSEPAHFPWNEGFSLADLNHLRPQGVAYAASLRHHEGDDTIQPEAQPADTAPPQQAPTPAQAHDQPPPDHVHPAPTPVQGDKILSSQPSATPAITITSHTAQHDQPPPDHVHPAPTPVQGDKILSSQPSATPAITVTSHTAQHDQPPPDHVHPAPTPVQGDKILSSQPSATPAITVTSHTAQHDQPPPDHVHPAPTPVQGDKILSSQPSATPAITVTSHTAQHDQPPPDHVHPAPTPVQGDKILSSQPSATPAITVTSHTAQFEASHTGQQFEEEMEYLNAEGADFYIRTRYLDAEDPDADQSHDGYSRIDITDRGETETSISSQDESAYHIQKMQSYAKEIYKAATDVNNSKDYDSLSKDVEAAKAAEEVAFKLRKEAYLNSRDDDNSYRAISDVKRAVIQGQIEWWPTDEVYKEAIKELSKLQISKNANLTIDAELIKKNSTAAFDSVKFAASKVSQDFIQEVEKSKKEKSPQDVYNSFLVKARDKAKEIAIKKAALTKKLDENGRSKASQEGLESLNHVILEAERVIRIREEDSIVQHRTTIATINAYLASQAEVVNSAEIAGRDAETSAKLADRDSDNAIRTARMDVIFATDIAESAAALEGKSQIDQYAAGAVGAAQSAATQAELKRLADVAAKSAQDNASLELENILQAGSERKKANAHAEIKSRSENAARKVLDKLITRRIEAADTKIEQTKMDITILAKEIETVTGVANFRTETLKSMEDAVKDARTNLEASGSSSATVVEGMVQVAATQLAIVQAQRDIAGSIRSLDKGNKFTSDKFKPTVQAVYDHINDQQDAERAGYSIIDKYSVAGETATHITTQWRAISSAVKSADEVEQLLGNNPKADELSSQAEEILLLLKKVVDSINDKKNDLGVIAYKLGAEVATQMAEVQNARLSAALARNRIAQKAEIPSSSDIEQEVRKAVDRVDTAIHNDKINAFLSASGLAPNDRDILKAHIEAREARRVATAEVKIAQAIEARAESVGYIINAANNPGEQGIIANLKADEYLKGLSAINKVIESGFTLEDVLAFSVQEAKGYKYIEECAKHINIFIYDYTRIANANRDNEAIELMQANSARQALNWLFEEVENARNANIDKVDVNPTLAAIVTARNFELSYEQANKAMHHLYQSLYRDSTHTNYHTKMKAASDALSSICSQRSTARVDPAIYIAQSAARITQNIIDNPDIDLQNLDSLNADNDAVKAKSQEAENEVRAAGDKVPDTLVVARKTEVVRMLDEVEAISKNGDVARSLDIASESAGAIARMLGEDEYYAADSARQTVRYAAIAQRTIAQALDMDDEAQITAQSKAATFTAARFAAQHAIALVGYERATDQFNQVTYIKQALSDYEDFTVNNAKKAQKDFIDQGQEAIRQYLSHKSYAHQNIEIQKFKNEFLRKVNETRSIIEAEGGDQIEQELAILSVAERLSTIEQIKSDLLYAKLEHAKLEHTKTERAKQRKNNNTAEKHKTFNERAEKYKSAEEINRLTNVTINIAKLRRMNESAQDTLLIAKLSKIVSLVKNNIDLSSHIDAILSTFQEGDRYFETYNDIINNRQNSIEAMIKDSTIQTSFSTYDSKLEKYKKLLEEVAKDAPPLIALEPTEEQKTLSSPNEAQLAFVANYDKIRQENNDYSESLLQELEKSAANVKNRANTSIHDIISYNKERVAAIIQTFIIQKSIDDTYKSSLTNITKPALSAAENGLPSNQGAIDIYNQRVREARNQAEAEVLNIVNNVAQKVDVITHYAEISAAVASYASSKTGGNAHAQEAAAASARQEVLETVRDMDYTIQIAQTNSHALLTAAMSARFKEIRQAVESLTKEDIIKSLMKKARAEDLTKGDLVESLTKEKLVEGLTKEDLVESLTKEDLVEGLTKEKLIDGLTKLARIRGLDDKAMKYLMELDKDKNMAKETIAKGLTKEAIAETLTKEELSKDLTKETIVKNLISSAKSKVLNAANNAFSKSSRDGDDLITQNLKVAEATINKAYELKGDQKGNATACKKAKRNIEAAITSTQTIAEAEGTIARNTFADEITRYAVSQASIAQDLNILKAYINNLGDQTFATIEGKPKAKEVADDFAKDLINQVDVAIASAPSSENPVEVYERAAAIATTYVENLLNRDATGNIIQTQDADRISTHSPLVRNSLAFTQAKGVANISQKYAKAASASIDRQGVDNAHLLDIAKDVTITIAENMAATIEIKIARDSGIGKQEEMVAEQKSKRALREIANEAETEAKLVGLRGEQQAIAVIDAVATAPASRIAVANEAKFTANTVQDGAKAVGFDDNRAEQMSSEFARDVRNAARDERHKKLEVFRSEAIENAEKQLKEEASQTREIHPSQPEWENTVKTLLEAALSRIKGVANKPLNLQKDITTQYVEAIATVKAQAAIEVAKIQIITSMERVNVALSEETLNTNQINTYLQEVDALVQPKETSAGTEVIRQYIAAAAEAKKMASRQVQFGQILIAGGSLSEDTKGKGKERSETSLSEDTKGKGKERSETSLSEDTKGKERSETPLSEDAKGRAQTIHRNALNKWQCAQKIELNTQALRETIMLSSAKRDALRLTKSQATEAELETQVRLALEVAEQDGETFVRAIRDQIEVIRSDADTVYRHGAKQQSKLGQTFGETLKAIAEPVKKAKAAMNDNYNYNYTNYFSTFIMGIYQREKKETIDSTLTPEVRIQMCTRDLLQAREVIIKLAKSMEETANVTRAAILAALVDSDAANMAAQEETRDVFNTFEKMTKFKDTNKHWSINLAEAAKAAINKAENIKTIYSTIHFFSEQAKKDANRLKLDTSQGQQETKIIEDLLAKLKYELHEAEEKGQDISPKNLKFLGQIYLYRMRLTTTQWHPQDFEKALDAEAKKIEQIKDKEATLPISELNPSQFFTKYREYLQKPNHSSAEQACLKEIKAYFENKNNRVHPYWYNQFCLENAITAARKGRFHLEDSAGYYISRMKLVPEPANRKSSKPEHLREGFEHDWVSYLQGTLTQSLTKGDGEKRIGYALAVVDAEIQKKNGNLQYAKQALDVNTSPKEAVKTLDQMDLSKARQLELPGEDVTDPEAVARQKVKKALEWNPKSLKELEARSPAEMAEQAEALNKLFAEATWETYQGLLGMAASQPEVLAALKENSPKIINRINKQLWENYKRDDAKKYEVLKMVFYQKEANRQFWKGFIKDWGLLTLRGGIEFGSRAEKDAMDQFLKIVKQALG